MVTNGDVCKYEGISNVKNQPKILVRHSPTGPDIATIGIERISYFILLVMHLSLSTRPITHYESITQKIQRRSVCKFWLHGCNI